jgi:ComF family protein
MERVRSVFYFEDGLREAIHRLKYRGCTALAEPLGAEMAAYWLRNEVPVDVVVPVPLHGARLGERGHNQAGLLAREFVRVTGLALDEKTLARIRATASQVGLSASERKENVRGAFRCRDGLLSGKRVLLVDDVFTTGATLDAAAAALYDGGVSAVEGLTLARAR